MLLDLALRVEVVGLTGAGKAVAVGLVEEGGEDTNSPGYLNILLRGQVQSDMSEFRGAVSTNRESHGIE